MTDYYQWTISSIGQLLFAIQPHENKSQELESNKNPVTHILLVTNTRSSF